MNIKTAYSREQNSNPADGKSALNGGLGVITRPADVISGVYTELTS